MKPLKTIICLFSLILFAQNASAIESDTAKKAGTVVLPEIYVKNMDGKSVNMADFGKSGKITIISFWATWCKPCIVELKKLDELLEEWTEKYGVNLVAVSVDDARNSQKVKPFVAGMGWTFEVLMDPNGDLQRALNVTNPPMTLLINKEGKVVYIHTGYLPGDEYELEKEIIKWKN